MAISFPSRYFKIAFFLVILFFASEGRQAQAQQKEPDTLSLTKEANRKANRAAIYSALLPGAGQVYNKSYWKVPVLYGGIAALVYFIDFNQDNYKTFKTAYQFRSDADSSTVDAFPGYTNEDLIVRKDYYRRNRDFCYIIAGVVYVLNIIDAYVDAHLKDFDVGDDLSFRPRPYMELTHTGMPVAGLKVCLKIGHNK